MATDLYPEYQQWTNEQMDRIVVESRQARIAMINEAMHLVDMMKTIYPRDSHWANIPREEAREIFHQLLRDCMSVVDNVLVGEPVEEMQVGPEPTPVIISPEISVKTAPKLKPKRKAKQAPRHHDQPLFLPPMIVATRLGGKKEEEEQARREKQAVDADASLRALASTMHKFYFDLALDAKRAANVQAGPSKVEPPSPVLSNGEEALFFLHSVYMAQLNEGCMNWAAFDVQLERTGYLYRHPECKLVVPERSAEENMSYVRRYNDLPDDEMGKYERPDAIARRKNFTVPWALESIMYNIPYAPAATDEDNMKTTILSPINMTLNDRPLPQSVEIARMEMLFADFYQSWHLPPDWDNFEELGRRTTLANVINGTGILTSTLVASALGLLPWVVRAPMRSRDITLSSDFDRTERNQTVNDRKPDDSNSGEFREEERYREALDRIRTAFVMRRIKARGEPIKIRDPIIDVRQRTPQTRTLLEQRSSIFDDSIVSASGEAPMDESASSHDHTVNVVDRFLISLARDLLSLPPVADITRIGENKEEEDITTRTNLFTTYLKSISPEGTIPERLLHGILRIYAQVPVLDALPTYFSASQLSSSPLRLFRKERIETARTIPGIKDPVQTVDEEIKRDERALREMLGVILMHSVLQTIFGHLAGPAGAVDLEGVDSFRHDPPECKTFQLIYMRFLTRSERSIPKWLWHAMREIDLVAKCGGYGPLHMNNDGGDPTSTPGIRSFTIAMDIASLTTRMAMYRRIFGHHISIWRRAVLLEREDDANVSVPDVSAPSIASTIRGKFASAVSWMRSRETTRDEKDEPTTPTDDPDRYFLRFVRIFDVCFTATIAEVFGHLTVGASNYSGLLALSGIPYDWAMARRYCLQASLLGGVTTEGLAQLAEVASDLASEERMGLTPLPTGFGAMLQLVDWLSTRYDGSAVRPDNDVYEWMVACAKFAVLKEGNKMTENEAEIGKNTFCGNYLEIVRNGNRTELERINALVMEMKEKIPAGYLANGLMLKYRLRRHLASIGKL